MNVVGLPVISTISVLPEVAFISKFVAVVIKFYAQRNQSHTDDMLEVGLMYTVSQKNNTLDVLIITSTNVDRFSKFFHSFTDRFLRKLYVTITGCFALP